VAPGGSRAFLLEFVSLVEHCLLHLVELAAQPVGIDGRERDAFFSAIETAFHHHRAAIDVARADFHAEGNAALFPMILFIAGPSVAPIDDDLLMRRLV